MKEIDVRTLKERLEKGEEIVLVDVREPYETEVCAIGGIPIPMSQLMYRLEEVPRDKPVIVHCRSGARSKAVIDALTTRYGYTNLINLKGGIMAWQAEVDPTLKCD